MSTAEEVDRMVTYNDYVAGWLDSSIRAFLEALPGHSDGMKYALVTCLDSDLAPRSLLKKSPALRPLVTEARPLGRGFLLPTRSLREADAHSQLIFGFDEVWFFPGDSIKPKPNSAWLVGPARIDQKKLDKLGAWMSENSCSLGLGDGEGLNFIVKARGLVRQLIGQSLDQPSPGATFVAAPAGSVAG
jgi:hypothetical protein